jgi:hypothetical protein
MLWFKSKQNTLLSQVYKIAARTVLTSGATRVMRAPARLTSHLLLECRAYEARLICSTYAWHSRGIHVTFAQLSNNIRTTSAWHFTRQNCIWHALHDAFVARVSPIHVLQMSRISSAYWKCAGPWVTFGQYCTCTCTCTSRYVFLPRRWLYYAIISQRVFHPENGERERYFIPFSTYWTYATELTRKVFIL